MNVRAIPRTAVEGYLRLVRVPLDGAVSLLPGNGTGARGPRGAPGLPPEYSRAIDGLRIGPATGSSAPIHRRRK